LWRKTADAILAASITRARAAFTSGLRSMHPAALSDERVVKRTLELSCAQWSKLWASHADGDAAVAAYAAASAGRLGLDDEATAMRMANRLFMFKARFIQSIHVAYASANAAAPRHGRVLSLESVPRLNLDKASLVVSAAPYSAYKALQKGMAADPDPVIKRIGEALPTEPPAGRVSTVLYGLAAHVSKLLPAELRRTIAARPVADVVAFVRNLETMLDLCGEDMVAAYNSVMVEHTPAPIRRPGPALSLGVGVMAALVPTREATTEMTGYDWMRTLTEDEADEMQAIDDAFSGVPGAPSLSDAYPTAAAMLATMRNAQADAAGGAGVNLLS